MFKRILFKRSSGIIITVTTYLTIMSSDRTTRVLSNHPSVKGKAVRKSHASVEKKMSNYHVAIYFLLFNKKNAVFENILPYELLEPIMLSLGVKKPINRDNLVWYCPDDPVRWIREVLRFDAVEHFVEMLSMCRSKKNIGSLIGSITVKLITLKNLCVKYCACEIFKLLYTALSKDDKIDVLQISSRIEYRTPNLDAGYPYHPIGDVDDDRVIEMVQLCNCLYSSSKLPSALKPVPLNKRDDDNRTLKKPKSFNVIYCGERVRDLYYRCLDTSSLKRVIYQLQTIINYDDVDLLKSVMKYVKCKIPASKLRIDYVGISVEMYRYLDSKQLIRHTPGEILSIHGMWSLSNPLTRYLIKNGHKPTVLTPSMYTLDIDHPQVALHFPGVEFASKRDYYTRLHKEGVPLLIKDDDDEYDQHMSHVDIIILQSGRSDLKWWRERILKEEYRDVWFPQDILNIEIFLEYFKSVLSELHICRECCTDIKGDRNHRC